MNRPGIAAISRRPARGRARHPAGHPARRRGITAIVGSAAVAAAALAIPVIAGPAIAQPAVTQPAVAQPALAGSGPAAPLRPACPAVPPGHMRCFALYRTQTAVNRAIAARIAGPAARPAGWAPRAIDAAYRLPVRRDSRQLVAISIAFDTPHLARYLASYRKEFGLPGCGAADGCFRKVNQRGKASPLPTSGVGSGWDLEATLDVSMVSAACPHCRILVVEANDDSIASLAVTDDTAARLGAEVISNSYGSRESGAALAFAKHYRHAGHTVVASSGDVGFTAASFPADLANVTSVGGTELARSRGQRRWRETVWNTADGASGSGCSAYVPKPSWQHDRHCPMRTVNDVAAVADNVPIYDKDWGGWVTVAGTSIAAPLIAGIYGLAGNAAKVRPGYLYRHRSALFDITAGNNGFFSPAAAACGGDYLCYAKKGYDGPTGLGTPDGTGAF